MPDKKLTDVPENNVGKMSDNEIVKALEYWKKFDEEIDQMLGGRFKDDKILLEQKEIVKITLNLFDLINRLQVENENYSKNNQTMTSDILKLYKELEQAKAEIDNLNGDLIVERTRRENAVNAYHEAKAEAYKECIEKVKEHIDTHEHLTCEECNCVPIGKSTLNNLLKELVGEENVSGG